MTLTIRSFSFVALALGMFLVACDRGPTAPDGPPPPPDPIPAPGTSVHKIPLLDTDKTLDLWIEKLNPEQGGQLMVGQMATVRWTCRGPAGYVAWKANRYWVEGESEPDPSDPSGGGSDGTNQCGVYTTGYPKTSSKVVTLDTPGVRGIRFSVWIREGFQNFFPDPGSSPDVVFDETLNWGAPTRFTAKLLLKLVRWA